VAEWIAMRAMAQGRRVCKKFPLVDLGSLGAAVCAVWGDRLLGRDNGEEAHLKLVDGDVRLVDVQHELAREDGTC